MKKPKNAHTRPGRSTELDRSDMALFDRVVADAKPLKNNRLPAVEVEFAVAVPDPENTKKPRKDSKPKAKQILTRHQLASEAASFPAALDDHGPGRTPGLDRRTELRLRRGQIAIEGRVDLHGMRQVEAHIALNAFIQGSYRGGRRCVLVITGKGARGSTRGDARGDARGDVGGGGRGDSEAGVLRRMTPAWLKDGPNRSIVLAYAPAQPRDGGAGAIYVLLRRQRAGQ